MLQAIAALNKALAADPNSLEVLLSLGVSHTNELDASKCDLTLSKGVENVHKGVNRSMQPSLLHSF